MPQAYVVYFQTGGADNFKWRYMNERFATPEPAREAVRDLRRAGYVAFCQLDWLMGLVGLPDAFADPAKFL